MDMPLEPPYQSEQVIERRLIDCGLDSEGISVKYEEYLQSIEIVISRSAGATSDHFHCIKSAVGYEIVTFEDSDMFAAYSEFSSELARPDLMAKLEVQLKEAALLENFPERDDFESLEAYATALEEHANVEPNTALSVAGKNIVFTPSHYITDLDNFMEQYSALLLVVQYASVRDRIGFFITGNEKVAK